MIATYIQSMATFLTCHAYKHKYRTKEQKINKYITNTLTLTRNAVFDKKFCKSFFFFTCINSAQKQDLDT